MKAIMKLAGPEAIVETEIDARDRRAFERFGRKETGMQLNLPLQDAVKISPETYMAWLAWHSLTRTHPADAYGDFTTFERRVISVDIPEIELEEENPFGSPTQAAKLDG